MRTSHRHLPHRYILNAPLFVTFRLDGSLPPGRYFPGGSFDSGKAFVCMDRLLDADRTGPRYLMIPSVAKEVVDAIHNGVASDYRLHAWVLCQTMLTC